MTKTIKQKREENKAVVFNMTLALDAIESTPAKARSSSTGFTADLIALFKEANRPLAINQVVAAFKANGQEITNKKVADYAWMLAKKGTLKKGEAKGTYEIA